MLNIQRYNTILELIKNKKKHKVKRIDRRTKSLEKQQLEET